MLCCSPDLQVNISVHLKNGWKNQKAYKQRKKEQLKIDTETPSKILCLGNMMKSTERLKLMEKNTKLISIIYKNNYIRNITSIDTNKPRPVKNLISLYAQIRFVLAEIYSPNYCTSTANGFPRANSSTETTNLHFINWPKLELLPFNLSN